MKAFYWNGNEFTIESEFDNDKELQFEIYNNDTRSSEVICLNVDEVKELIYYLQNISKDI